MATQEFSYFMTVTIQIKGTAKKNTVRDTILQKLQEAKTAGNIEQADWSLTGTPTPEGGKI